jgi:hypothetical protein
VNPYSGSISGLKGVGAVSIAGDLIGGNAYRTGAVYSEQGKVASVTIGGSVIGGGASSDFAGSISGKNLGTITIHGDLAGNIGSNSGTITAKESIGNVTVGGSIFGAGDQSGRIAANGAAGHFQIGNVTVGGSIVGGYAGSSSGGIFGPGVATEKMGAVKIGGDIVGSTGTSAGQIDFREIASITVGGSLIGSSREYSAYLHGAKVGAVNIGGDLVGGGYTSASIEFASTTSITVAGSILGGTADFAGHIGGNVGTIVVGHDIRGANITTGAPLYNGSISGGTVGSVTVGGSLIAGTDNSSGSPSNGGSIVLGSLGSLTIKGSVIGNSTMTANIQASLSITSISVGGRVEFGQIGSYLAGAQLGSLKIGGDWIASNLSVGLNPNSNFGNGSDARSTLPGGLPNVLSKIGSITIGGQVKGPLGVPSRTFGFGAEQIGSFKVGTALLPLKTGAHTDKFAAAGQVGTALAVGATPGSVVNDGFAVHVFEV